MIILQPVPGFAEAVKLPDGYGQIENGLYTNHAMGARAYFGENWRILSPEEIAVTMNLVKSSSKSLKELMEQGQMPSFLAVANDESADVNIVITKFSISESVS